MGSTLGYIKIGVVTPNILEYEKPDPGARSDFLTFIKSEWPCKPAIVIPGIACDEYPFASTKQGGLLGGEDMFEHNLKYNVTTIPVPSWESSKQGQLLMDFYQKNDFYPSVPLSSKGVFGNNFLVNSGLPRTQFITYYLKRYFKY